VRDGEIATPGQHNSILDGITRRSIIQIASDLGYSVCERSIARAELYLAEEVFMSGTAAELVPVREIDDHRIGSGRPGEITRVLQDAFNDATYGRSERYREWLDPIETGVAGGASAGADTDVSTNGPAPEPSALGSADASGG